MQSIALENNLAETVFFVDEGSRFAIRWFTPRVEVELCGHATLAAGYVVYDCLGYAAESILFWSPHSGPLYVSRRGAQLYLDFPADTVSAVDFDPLYGAALGATSGLAYRGRSDLMIVLDNEAAVAAVKPDFRLLASLGGRGVIVTAPGEEFDFVSRFFAPQSGIDEDPVTGSAHTSLIPYWSQRLGKTELSARQLSSRGGTLTCRYMGERVEIGGNCVLYMQGQIKLPDLV